MKEKVTIKFAACRTETKIPCRENGNVGYDIYACFPEDLLIIEPHETKMVSTGLMSIIPEGYAIILKDRGSTGSKGIHTACGVIDSNYRGEWFVALHNDTNKRVAIVKENVAKVESADIIYYPYTKAITQAILIENIDSDIEEIDMDTVENDITNRGTGKIGSSGK